MKNRLLILLVFIILMNTKSTAQLKIYTGGSISFGSTVAPTNGEKHKFTGDIVVSSSATPSGSAIRLRGNNGYSGAATPDYTWLGNDQTGFFHPTSNVIGFTIGGSEKARFTSNGNFLVGTTTDNGNKLQVTGSNNQCALLNTSSNSTNYGYCQINQVNNNTTKAYSVYSSASGTNMENYIVYGSGLVWALTYTSWSDKTLKENIDSLPNSLKLIKQLSGVKYNFKSSVVGPGPVKTEIGLIAQEVENVIPEVVYTNDKGIKSIAYQNIIPLLIEGMKEQDKKITQLQNDLTTCCNKNSERLLNPENGEGNKNSIYTSSYIKQNLPNPFNKETNINYFISEKGADAAVLVFDMNGKLLKTIKITTLGNGSLTISANDFQPGMYYYSLIINNKEIDTKKMILTE